MVEEIDRDSAPAAPEVEPAPRYVWTANHTAAKDAIVYRRAIAENPNAVPLRVWQFCEENGVDVCLFDGVAARNVTELEEILALSSPHAHAQIRADGAVLDVPPVDPQVEQTVVEQETAPLPVEPNSAEHDVVHEESAQPDQEHSSGE